MSKPADNALQFAVNNNGDSRDRLISNYRAVLNAANELSRVMAEASPHGPELSDITGK